MAIEVARNYRFEVGTVYGGDITITAISKAAQPVVTGTHSLIIGDYVLFGAIDGMSELSYVLARVSAISTTVSFTLEAADITNSTNFGTFVSGTAKKVTTFATLSTATSVDFGAGAVEALDVTTLVDIARQSTAGLLQRPDVTVQLFADVASTVQTFIDTSAQAGTILAFRATKPSGARRLFAGMPSEIGESAQVNTPIGGSFTIIPRSQRIVKYTS
jgi:hypothetical protein